MNRYSSYKDSGVEWIGEIPNHWEKVKVKFLGKVGSGDSLESKFIEKDEGDFPVYGGNGVMGYYSDFNYNQPILIIGRVGEKCGNVHYSDKKVYVNDNSLVFESYDDRIELWYIYHSLTQRDLNQLRNKNTQPLITGTIVKDESIPLPPIREQQQIVSFLDDKTQKIDSLIQQKKNKIKLLKEKRTSLINHVVTKGLDPNVEMKDSGVEWVGEIPSHWETGKLKNNSDLKISSVDKHILEEERKVIVCNYTDVYYNEFITSNLPLRKGSCSENQHTNFLLNKGDVIITKDSESPTDIGVPSLVKDDLENVVCGYHLSIMKPHKTKLVGGYLFRQLQTKRIRSYFEINSNGITRFGLGKSSVLETLLILPPISEQEQIVEYLDKQTEEIDTLIQLEQKKIDTLKEYRQSLISEVVTGKIKVV